jgi:hypothetical protein
LEIIWKFKTLDEYLKGLALKVQLLLFIFIISVGVI